MYSKYWVRFFKLFVKGEALSRNFLCIAEPMVFNMSGLYRHVIKKQAKLYGFFKMNNSVFHLFYDRRQFGHAMIGDSSVIPFIIFYLLALANRVFDSVKAHHLYIGLRPFSPDARSQAQGRDSQNRYFQR